MQIVLDTAGHFTYSAVSPAQCMNIRRWCCYCWYSCCYCC